jgi:SAM-dependent methyltransferase
LTRQPLPPCRSCGYDGLQLILSLGRTPLANALLTEANLHEPEATYPLELAFCPNCALVQITETVPPEILFSNYFYFSSFSDTFLQHASELSNRLIQERKLGKDSLVIEVASNDGYLLQYYHQRGIPVLGIEPAANVAKVAVEKYGVRTLVEFFGEAVARKLREQGQQADVIHANNVLAHVADLNGFVEGIHLLLKDDGVALIEAPYVKDLIDHVEFDTIYHEHLCYYSLTTLERLFQRHGLTTQDVKRIPLHGGSLQITVAQAGQAQPSPAVTALLQEESGWGVDQFAFYEVFGRKVESLKQSLLTMLADLKRDGKRLAAYGASAKGSTLLNYFGIGRDVLDYVVDRSTYKQGHYTPGTHLPIYSPTKLVAEMPDYVLLLTWNFADEIRQQQAEYVQRGGHFILPIPEPKIL